jgi:hypothetical protein
MLSETINIVFCAAIVFIGSLAFRKTKNISALLIAIAFGMFGLSYLFGSFSAALAANNFFIVIRVLAFAAIIFVLYEIAYKKGEKTTEPKK